MSAVVYRAAIVVDANLEYQGGWDLLAVRCLRLPEGRAEIEGGRAYIRDTGSSEHLRGFEDAVGWLVRYGRLPSYQAAARSWARA